MKMKSKRRLICAACVATVVLVVAAGGVAVQTSLFKKFLARRLETAAGRALNAQLSIGGLDGDYVSHMVFTDVRLTDGNDSLVFVPRLYLSYSLVRLLRRQIHVRSLRIDSPIIRFDLSAEGGRFFSRSDEATAAPPTDRPQKRSDKGFPFSFEIDTLAVTRGRASLVSPSPILPKEITELTLEGGGSLQPKRFTLSLRKLRLSCREPEWTIDRLSFTLQKDGSGLTLRDARLKTGRNAAHFSGQSSLPLLEDGRVRLETSPIDWGEFSFLLPDITVPGNPSLLLQASAAGDEASVEVRLGGDDYDVNLTARAAPISNLLSDSTKRPYHFRVNASLRNVELERWLADLEQPLQLNGELKVNGRLGVDRAVEAETELQLFNSRFADWRVTALNARGRYRKDVLSLAATLETPMGSGALSATVEEPFAEQRFEAEAVVKGLDLSQLPGMRLPSSRLNGSVSAKGKHLFSAHLQTDARVRLDSLIVADVPLDSLAAIFSFADGEFRIERLQAADSTGAAAVTGLFSLSGASNLELRLRATDPPLLRRLIGADSLKARLQLGARLQGKIDSLILRGSLESAHLRYKELKADTLAVTAFVRHFDGKWQVHGAADASAFQIGETALDSVRLEGDWDGRTLTLEGELRAHERARLEASGRCRFDEPMTVYLPKVRLRLGRHLFSGGSDSMQVILGKERLEIRRFSLESTADSRKGGLYAHGMFSRTGSEDFHLELQNVDASLLTELLPTRTVSGFFTLRMRVNGDAARPIVDLSAELRQAKFGEFSVRTVNANGRYESERLVSNLTVSPQNDSLLVQIDLPMRLSFEEGNLGLLKERPIRWSVHADSLRLDELFFGRPLFDASGGTLALHIESADAGGPFEPKGFVRLTGGRLLHKRLGFELNEMQMNARLDPGRVTLEEFSGRRGRGRLRLNGFAELQNRLNEPLKSFRLGVQADRLLLSNRPQHELQVDADITVAGDPSAPTINGELAVRRASFNTGVFSQEGSRNNGDERRPVPLLVQALQEELSETAIDTLATAAEKKPAPDLWRHLSGVVKVKIPRNTWVRNDKLRLELSGEVDVVKSPQSLELFGTIRVLRGQYDFWGRRFAVSEGQVTFQGGDRIDPLLDIKSDYVFRDSRRSKRFLRLIVTGKASEPQVRFTLDDAAITEGEAAAYLLFGRSPEELTAAQEGRFADVLQPERLAATAAYGLLSAQLARHLGSALSLDLVEIQGQESLNAATFIVGKYLTPDLFMSYEYSFGASEDRPPQVVTIEYELARFLFLQLISGDSKASGADVVFKWAK